MPQCRAIRELMEAEGLDVSGIRNIRDERLPDGSLKQQNQIPNSLGMSESFGPHGALPVGSLLPDHRRGAYAPTFGGFERRVVDPVTAEVLPPSRTGELQIRGGALMRGYYKRERSTAFTPDGFFPTQDLVRIEPDGYMYFEGRTGDMLKTKGANVSRLEVEEALRKVPGVAEAFVCGLPDSEAGQLVVAAATPVAGNRLTESSLKAALRGLLAPYKIPAHIVLIGSEDMLWTATGKIRVSEMSKVIAEKLEVREQGTHVVPRTQGVGEMSAGRGSDE
jgi:acyl-CoA synthetase (AMP-forming)/AMP-acid ligase II